MARIPDYVKVIDLPSGRRYEVRPEVTGADGKRRQKRKRFKTLKEAVDQYTTIAGDRGRGLHVAPSELTVQEAVDSWLFGQRIRSKTMSAYVTSLRPIVDHLGDRPVQNITKDGIEAVVQALRTGTATADDPFAIAWLLAVYGLRRGEILAVDIDKDIDLDANTIRVDESRIAVAGGSVTGATKTVTSTRTLPMPEDLARAVRRERKRHAKLTLLLGSKWTNPGLLVVDELGNPPHPDTLTAAWRRALSNAGLPHVRLHDARHSCATLMHLNRVPVV